MYLLFHYHDYQHTDALYKLLYMHMYTFKITLAVHILCQSTKIRKQNKLNNRFGVGVWMFMGFSSLEPNSFCLISHCRLPSIQIS